MDATLPPCLLRGAGETLSPAEIREWLSTAPRYTSLRVHGISAEEFMKRLQSKAPCFVHPQLPDTVIFPAERKTLEGSFKSSDSGWIIVDQLCGAAILRGADIFVPGVLAASTDVQVDDEVDIYVNTGSRILRGAKNPEILKECIFVARGIARFSRCMFFSVDSPKSGVGVTVTWIEWKHPNFNAWSDEFRRHFFAQNVPAIVVGHVVQNALKELQSAGEAKGCLRALDMCAAPGGKTTHLASLLGDSGVVFAIDKSRRRLDSLEENARRLNLTNVKAFAYNSCKVIASSVDHLAASEESEKPPFHQGTFDVVVLDPPCSALGQRPTFRVEATDVSVAANVVLQRALFRQAVEALSPNGVLVYSTCSLSLEENEEIVVWALEMFPALQLVPAVPKVGRDGHPVSTLSETQRKKVQRFGPVCLEGDVDLRDTVGFFIACFIVKK